MKFQVFTFALLVTLLSGYRVSAQKLVKTDGRYKIAVVDLMILKRQKLSAFQLSKELGADGVEVDMGGMGDRETFDNKLADDTIRTLFLDKAKEYNLEIASLAMTGFYAQSFPERPTAVKAVGDCINTMKKMNVKIGFLPLGIQGDLTKFPEKRPAVVARLKEVGKLAEAAGVIIGIETSLSATDELKLLSDIGSPAIQIYFNFSNAITNGRDLYKEMEILGSHMCQIHSSNHDSVWLQNDKTINMNQVKQTLDKIGYRGWLVIERSRDASDPKNVKRNFGANVAYLKSIFQ
ncbi:endonuclease [Niastella koreensis]|uniref:Xylose isomerase domain-containing protein TIM barrel n=2 Tax=Niastella koreensis TaxID=354356 RepID=G8TNH7_NIAKG|nr:sugar phosphate isomerase/epimerase family protein [Niastella koreensis]AEV99894.1 Xylose isomerase domain-containing protein TIM barrel [Niastella koreensis GR20-10]OQP51493.1 endonuclease [Niastella koreensis]